VILYGGYYFIGQYNQDKVKTVASFSNSLWSKIGELKYRRYAHNGIKSGSDVIIVGGYSETLKTEVWDTIENKSTAILPEFYGYDHYPHLFHVNPDFCANK
jgi:hypothetical protein